MKLIFECIAVGFASLLAILAIRRWRQAMYMRYVRERWEATRKHPNFIRSREEVERWLLNSNKWRVQIIVPSCNELTNSDLAKIASSAFGKEFGLREGELDPIDVAFFASEKDDSPQIAGSGPHFYVTLPPHLFEVFSIGTEEGRLVNIQYSPSVTSHELENGFRLTGKLAAQFIRDTNVTVKLNDEEFARIAAPIAIEALCSDDPFAAFESLQPGSAGST